MTIKNPQLYSSACMDWETDDELIGLAHAFAPIALDVATAPDNPTRARQWIAPPRDSLQEDWAALMGPRGHLWDNPPYGPSTARFVAKHAANAWLIEHQSVLTAARPDTAWYRQIIASANAVIYLSGRRLFKIRCGPCTFVDYENAPPVYATRWFKDGGYTHYVCSEDCPRGLILEPTKPIGRAAFPSMLSYWGWDVDRWRSVFGALGDFRFLRAGSRELFEQSRQRELFP